MLSPVLLVGVLGLAAPAAGPTGDELRVDTPQVDQDAVLRGLRARVGERLDGWHIRVGEGGEVGEVEVSLVRPDQSEESRRLSVTGETTDDRSRELAASLALIVDQYVPPAHGESGSHRARVRRFFIGLGPRLGVGKPPHPDVGGSFVAGAWLVGEHLMPRLAASWSASWDGTLFFHGVRFGAGLGAGAPLAGGRLWLGGYAQPQAAWVQARDEYEVDRWIFAPEGGALLQLRLDHLVVGLRTGVDLAFPPLRAHGNDAEIRWGTFRYMVGLVVGPRFWAPQNFHPRLD